MKTLTWSSHAYPVESPIEQFSQFKVLGFLCEYTLLVIDSFDLLLLLPFLVHIFYMYIFVCIELMNATKKTFTPEPALLEFTEMFENG